MWRAFYDKLSVAGVKVTKKCTDNIYGQCGNNKEGKKRKWKTILIQSSFQCTSQITEIHLVIQFYYKKLKSFVEIL